MRIQRDARPWFRLGQQPFQFLQQQGIEHMLGDVSRRVDVDRMTVGIADELQFP